jgi:hypothetical protein
MGPCLVVSQGNSLHSKQCWTPFWWAQLQIAQNLFSRATQPTAPLGQVPLVILGHFSQAIPQTPTFIFPSIPVVSDAKRIFNVFALLLCVDYPPSIYSLNKCRFNGLVFIGSLVVVPF